ncbi:lipid A biosynthesis acyltransferase [Hyphomicrobium sp. LHD-15]|uniref:lysophospholipid acyltransferase family protein n=1 Tax=Hyphomicrobium sp. LHD-15 TaxID=3072142 RepID=UPI00280CD733|nr:lipid A biosynthesis acyltransferase [Hyphomicrobium sp. LHD-15]MDQ8697542.1 lipid A biosynthesis acyltransferase [Hyphomicrobium sp. LHD-15]
MSSSRISFGRDLQFRLEYGLLRLIVGLVRILPLETATGLSARAWRFLAPRVNPKRQARALANLAIAFPEKSEAERLAICMAHWENLGRVMAETMQIDRLIQDPSRIRIVSDRLFGRYKNKLGPAIGVSLHMGNWELSIWPFVEARANPAAVYRSVNNPYIDSYLRWQRRDLYPGGLFGRGKVEGEHGDNQKTARILTDFVRTGGRLGLVCDLYDRTGLPVPFFGQDARTQAIGAMIARRVGSRIWMSCCRRVGTSSRFEIEIKELRVPRTKNISDDVRWIMVEMQKQFETWVRETPEQWMWSNRRWS